MPRRFRRWLTLAPILVLSIACTSQPAPTPKTDTSGASKTAPTVELKAPGEPVARPAGSPTAAAPTTAAKAAASPVAAASPTAVARVEPKGKLVYAWNTSLSPQWYDPAENGQILTQYAFQYALHDALVRHLPGQPMTPSLAESYELAPDFKSATFKIRPNAKFHNGESVTSEDVKFTFENYKGANAKILKDKTASLETPDPKTVKFNFKEPFLDFLVLYGTPASGAGWILPKKYYQEVGPDAYKQKPIGAGPYKFVRQVAGTELELEAFTDYWRKTPSVKTLIFRGIPEDATRTAAVQTGEVDIAAQIQGPMIDIVRSDPNLRLTTRLGAPFWLEMPGFEKADNPFNNLKVRQAVSLAINRQELSEHEQAGLARPLGNWLPVGWPGALEYPELPHDLAKAKQLMAEAGYPNGFEVESLTPLPPYFSLAERIITQLREIGIRTRLNQMERGAFTTKITEGPDAFKGLVLNISAAPGDAAARVRAFAVCKGSSSRTCVPEVDEKFTRYDASSDPKEREQLLNEIQKYMYDNLVFVPIFRQAYLNAVGPRVANEWEEIVGAIPQYSYVGPYEDLRLKE